MKERMTWDSAEAGLGDPVGVLPASSFSRSRSRSLEPPVSKEYSDLRSVSTPTRWHPQYNTPGIGYSSTVDESTGSGGSSSFSARPRSNGSLSSANFLSPIPEDRATLHHSHSDQGIHSETITLSDDERRNGEGNAGHQFITRRRHSENDLMLRTSLPDATGGGRFAKRGRERAGKNRRLNRAWSDPDQDWAAHSAQFYFSRGADNSASTSSEGYSSSPSNALEAGMGIRSGSGGLRYSRHQGGARGSLKEDSSSESESSETTGNNYFSGRGVRHIDRRRSTSFLDFQTSNNSTDNGRSLLGDHLSSSFSPSKANNVNNNHDRQRRHSYHPASFATADTLQVTNDDDPLHSFHQTKGARRSSQPNLQRRSSIASTSAGGISVGTGPGGGGSSSQSSSRRPSVQSDMQRRLSLKKQPQQSSSPTKVKPSSSSNSLAVPSRGGGSSSDQADGDVSAVTPSDVAAAGGKKTSQSGSRRQNIFDMSAGGGNGGSRDGGSTISAQMVSNDPARAASLAFSSLSLPADFMLAPASKHFRRICSPLITCFILLILAGSMTAAVYFAVVLNKTQAEHIEYLKATLHFHLENASAKKLTSLNSSELYAFEKQYCQEIGAYYRSSKLADNYKGCDAAAVQDGQLRVALYFDSIPTNQSSNDPEQQREVIRDVLASSAARVGQNENDVIFISNIEVKLDTVDISLKQTSDVPEFIRANDKGQSPNAKADTTKGNQAPDINTSPGALVSTKPKKEEQVTPFKPTKPSTPQGDGEMNPMHPCQPAESGTYYRYPGSCSLFFQCLDGESITMGCGDDLVFDMDSKTCISEVNDCDVDVQAAEMYGDGFDPEDLQPCEHKGGSLYPHPRVCNLYFQCSASGSSVVGVCPHSLVYDVRVQICNRLSADIKCPQASGSPDSGKAGGARDSVLVTRGMDLGLHPADSAKDIEKEEKEDESVAGTMNGVKLSEHEESNTDGDRGVTEISVEHRANTTTMVHDDIREPESPVNPNINLSTYTEDSEEESKPVADLQTVNASQNESESKVSISHRSRHLVDKSDNEGKTHVPADTNLKTAMTVNDNDGATVNVSTNVDKRG